MNAARLALAVLAAGACLGFSGCGSSEEAALEKRLSADDLRWVQRFGVWAERQSQAEAEAGQVYLRVLGREIEHDELESSLGPIRSCADRFEDEVGRAPGPRFEPIETLVYRACAHSKLSAEALGRSLDDEPGQALRDHDLHRMKGSELMAAAARGVERRLLANQPLPVRGGMGTTSRIEPSLGRAARRLLGRRAEVRCWSSADWRQVVQEWAAYWHDPADIFGFASPNFDRVHLAPDICAPLTALAYRGRQPAARKQKLDLAVAVIGLTHEVEHLFAPSDEARTQCVALQRARIAARALGARPGYAAELAELYWHELYHRLPDDYYTFECRDGQEFDIRPNSSVWP